jgi:hypothetical protein
MNIYYTFKSFYISVESCFVINIYIYIYIYICVCVIFESQFTAHDVKPGLVTFVVYADFRMINIDILILSLPSSYVHTNYGLH